MDIGFSEQDLQFQEEIRAGLNGAEYPAHVKEKQEKIHQSLTYSCEFIASREIIFR